MRLNGLEANKPVFLANLSIWPKKSQNPLSTFDPLYLSFLFVILKLSGTATDLNSRQGKISLA